MRTGSTHLETVGADIVGGECSKDTDVEEALEEDTCELFFSRSERQRCQSSSLAKSSPAARKRTEPRYSHCRSLSAHRVVYGNPVKPGRKREGKGTIVFEKVSSSCLEHTTSEPDLHLDSRMISVVV